MVNIKLKLENYNNIKAEIKKLYYEIKCLEEEIKTDKINIYRIDYKRAMIERLEAEIDFIDAVIATLKPLEQKIITLRYIKGLLHEEIAVQVVRDISSVYRIEAKALKKIERWLI